MWLSCFVIVEVVWEFTMGNGVYRVFFGGWE